MSGSINPTTQSLEVELLRRINNLEAELVQIKNRQPVGVDIIKMQTLPSNTSFYVGPFSCSPADGIAIAFQAAPLTNNYLTLYNYAVSLLIDAPAHSDGSPTSGYNFPFGLQTSHVYPRAAFQFSAWRDFELSNDATNQPTFIVTANNNDYWPASFTVDDVVGNTHTFWFEIAVYLPDGNISGTVNSTYESLF